VVDEVNACVRAYVRQHALIAAGNTVVVAVSGGADSLCLLHVLQTLAPDLGCNLHVAHLNHALRPASGADAAFVAERAAELGLPYTVERRDVGALARAQRVSLETAARRARYEFLHGVAAAASAAGIATGHTRDDQAETLLLHLARGSGLGGLAGMPPRRDALIRPLLEVGHAQTVAYCAALGLVPRQDESNLSPAHRRNRIRREALPRLEAIQPAASANIARAARLLAADLALIERLARHALAHAVTRRDGAHVRLSATRLLEAEPELRPHMLRLLLADLLGHAEGFGERDYVRILEAIASGAPRASLALPKGLVLDRHGDEVMIGRATTPPGPVLGNHVLPVPGAVQTEVGLLRAEPATAPDDWAGVPPSVAYLDPAVAGPTLTVRAWRPGDRVRPLGLGGTRKVQDVFIDRKVPRALRGRIPIIEGPRGIAWLAGLCVSEAYRAGQGAAAVRLTWWPMEPPEGTCYTGASAQCSI
jgi:tRNA(Ile)-lysidine synthase